MSVVISNEYDHIDVVTGANTNRHYIKDATARDGINNVVLVQDTQPVNEYNKVWVKQTSSGETQVPTMEEFNSVKNAIDAIESPATSADEGKALLVKTVSGGKVTEWEYGEVDGMSAELKNALSAFLNQLVELIPSIAFTKDPHNGAATAYAANNVVSFLTSTYCVMKTLSHCSLSNSTAVVNKDESYSSNIVAESGFALNSVKVVMGGTDITSTAYNSGTGAISIASVTGNIIITASANYIEQTYYSITKNLTNCAISNSASSIVSGASYTATVSANSGYEMNTVTITMGGTNVTSSAYNSGTGAISIASVTGDIVVTASANSVAPSTYTITKNLTNCTISNNASSVASGGSYSATISANSEYQMDSVTITMGGTNITSTAYNSGTGAISIASVTGNIVITATASSTAVTVSSIQAVLNLGNAIIRTSNGLNDLKNYLTVKAIYTDSSEVILQSNDYTLSGSLTLASGKYDVSEQTITVAYGGKTGTFNVNVYNELTQSRVTLPSGYTQLAMVETPGNKECYIDTGILGSAVDHVEYGVQAKSGIGNGTNWHVLAGSRTWYPYFRQGSSGARNFQGKNQTTSGTATSIDVTWEPDTNYIIQAYPDVVINGETVTTIASAGSADNVNIYVFARNTGTTVENPGKIRMFYLKMYDDQNQVTHYFIPCKNSSDVAGLYDTVGASFFPSSGTIAIDAGGAL